MKAYPILASVVSRINNGWESTRLSRVDPSQTEPLLPEAGGALSYKAGRPGLVFGGHDQEGAVGGQGG